MACLGNEKPQKPQASDTISVGKIDGVLLVRHLPVQRLKNMWVWTVKTERKASLNQFIYTVGLVRQTSDEHFSLI